MRKLAIIFLTSIFLSLTLSTNLFAKQEHRLALLIGNSNYAHGGSLPNPVNDVRAIKRALEDLGFTVMKYEDCSQKTMKRAMDKFGRKLKSQDVGLFFYAGHGVQVNGHNYLLPVDAKLDSEHDAEYDCVRADRALAKMEAAGSRTNIVILDACRDNPFERSWRRGADGAGLAFMDAPSGSLIAYSTAPGKTASDGGGSNSPYTFALLEHIDIPNITVLQMFQRVRSTVRNRSENKQTPWESTSLNGDFFFNDQRKDVVGKEHKEEKAKRKSRLFIATEPGNARVRILNIKPKFYQGIELKPGSYHIEVSASGYKTKKTWIRLDDENDKSLGVKLTKAAVENRKKRATESQSLEKKKRLAAIKDKIRIFKADLDRIEYDIQQAKLDRDNKKMRAGQWYNGILAQIGQAGGDPPSFAGMDAEDVIALSKLNQQNQQQNQQMQMFVLLQTRQKYDSMLQEIDNSYRLRTETLIQEKLRLSEKLFDLMNES